MITKFRDITIIDIGNSTMTVACDSCAGVGELDSDIVKTDGYFAGYLTAFVPLAETLAIGATPKLLVNTLSMSGDGYGQSIVDGIKKAAKDAGLIGENIITGSTEENFIVPVTSLGITVIGVLNNNQLPKHIDSTYDLYLVGLPKVGNEVLDDRDKILTLNSVIHLKSNCNIIDILPVGSKGILYELNMMSNTINAKAIMSNGANIDMNKSAGPATCAIVAMKKNSTRIFNDIHLPINKLGMLVPKNSYKKV